MLGRVYSGSLFGVEGELVCVEADASEGVPQFEMIGLLERSVAEAKERVKTALKNTGIYLAPKRYTINLSPADLKKQGNGFDLPIAVAVLIAVGALYQKSTDKILLTGELGLDGALRPIDGCLSLVSMAKEKGFDSVIVPFDNGLEASVVKGIKVYPLKNLSEVYRFLRGEELFLPKSLDVDAILAEANSICNVDYSEINGQYHAKRAAEIAAAGGHNLLLIGPPGSGKTMLAKRLPGILPSLSLDEAIAITKVYSACGLLSRDKALVCERPFRNPHHTTSTQALVGGGRIPRPGEVTLAGKGVLFLDELPEFNHSSLEVLRQPLEDKEIVLSRVQATYRFPADFQLVACMNPCRCGFYPDRTKCSCSQADVSRYLRRISKPLLDRIDICIEVPRIKYSYLNYDGHENETTLQIRERVERAVLIQKNRYRNEPISYNSQLTPALIGKYCKLGAAEEELLKFTFEELDLSARAYHKILKVSRTIADLSGSEDIKEEHICEAIGYRSFEKEVWQK